VDPYEYLVGKLAQVEVAIEDFESVAEETQHDQEVLVKLDEVRDKLLLALAALEVGRDFSIPRHPTSSS
jgi:hypothetical protein